MPIWAPVGGSAGAEMNGQNTGAWSLVIRHATTGACGWRPAASAAGGAAARGVAATAVAPSASGPGVGWWAGRGRSRTAAVPCPGPREGRETNRRVGDRLVSRAGAIHQASPVRVRLMPSGTVEAANAVSWAQVESQRGEPGASDRGVQAAAELGDPQGLGDRDGAHRVGPGQGVAAGQLGVQCAGLMGVVALLGAGLAAGASRSSPRPGRRPTRRCRTAGRPWSGDTIGKATRNERRSPDSLGVRIGARAPITAPRVGQLDGGADRVPGVVAVVPHRRVRPRRAGHRPRHVGVDARVTARRRARASTMPARSPGANPVRQASASSGLVSHLTEVMPSGPRSWASISPISRYSSRQRPSKPPPDSLADSGDPCLGDHEGDELSRCAPRPG